MPDEVLPEYVPRDADAAEHGVRAKVAAAAERGGFVLLVGGSSVGKTRCAAEAVKALLPDWWLVHPAGPAEVAALAAAPPPRTVVWLDELQRYLDGEHGLTGGMVRALLNAPDPVVIIGTLWPDRYAAYTAVPAPGGADPHAREREVLDLADVIRIGPEFSPAEQDRARAAAARDRRLGVALESAGYGLTQTLAAAPQLVARWEDAQTGDPYAWAVLTAALDAARLGARAPLSAGLLRAAAPGYCTSAQQAEAPGNWFEQALAYATEKLHGAAAALAPAGAGMGQVAGYTVADYLIQHASRERRYARVPASTWDALLSHIGDPADAARLADSARGRLLYRYAIPLYRRAADAGDGTPPGGWPGCWPSGGTWRSCAPGPTPATGSPPAAGPAAGRARGPGRGCAPAPTPGDGTPPAAGRAAGRARGPGRSCAPAPTPATRTPPGGWPGCWPSAATWTGAARPGRRRRQGRRTAAGRAAGRARRPGGAARPRRRRRQAAAGRLAGLLAERGDLDGASAPAPTPATGAAELAAAGRARGPGRSCAPAPTPATRTPPPAGRAAGRRPDEAAGAARPRRRRRPVRRRQLAELLAGRGDLDGLRARADAGDRYAARRLADLLAERGDLDEAARILRERGSMDIRRENEFLVGRGGLERQRALTAAGNGDAGRLAAALARQGQTEEAKRLLQFGLNPDGSIACE